MSGIDQLGQRIRAATPAVDGAPPPLARVIAAIERERSRSWWARRVAAGRRTVVLALAGVLVAGGAAWAATALLSGASVAPAYVIANPGVSYGVPITSSLAILPIRAADPQGGPPWAMRVIRTTRGLDCIQVGRVVNGQLGVLGIGHAFHDDGRFHELLPQDSLWLGCQPLDKHGNVFFARGPSVQSASALSLAYNTTDQVRCNLPGFNGGPRCPPAALREVADGLLGPDAKRITVTTGGRTFTIKPYGRDGAYLIVLPSPADANAGPYGALDHAPPDAPVMTAYFKTGQTCRLGHQCPAIGIDYASPTNPSAAQLESPVHVTYQPHGTGTTSPLLASDGAGMVSVQQPGVDPGPARLTITFHAKIAVDNPNSFYDFQITRSVVNGCFGGQYLVGDGTDNTITAGRVVQFTIPLDAACHGTYRVRVFYISVPPGEDLPAVNVAITPFAGALAGHTRTPTPGHTVGTTVTTIP
jgi:hypothetical protein